MKNIKRKWLCMYQIIDFLKIKMRKILKQACIVYLASSEDENTLVDTLETSMQPSPQGGDIALR